MSQLTVAARKVVSVTYLIRDKNAQVQEMRDLPVSYIHGINSELFPQIEQALDGKAVGDTVKVTIQAADAFGEHDPALTFTDRIDNVPPELRALGRELEAESEGGERRTFRVTDISGDRLTVDANHPLAGQDLQYEVTVASIRDADDDELANRAPRPDMPTIGAL